MSTGADLVVASNRGPGSFVRDETGRLVAPAAGGLASSLVSALEGRNDAIWVSAGEGGAAAGGGEAPGADPCRLWTSPTSSPAWPTT